MRSNNSRLLRTGPRAGGLLRACYGHPLLRPSMSSSAAAAFVRRLTPRPLRRLSREELLTVDGRPPQLQHRGAAPCVERVPSMLAHVREHGLAMAAAAQAGGSTGSPAKTTDGAILAAAEKLWGDGSSDLFAHAKLATTKLRLATGIGMGGPIGAKKKIKLISEVRRELGVQNNSATAMAAGLRTIFKASESKYFDFVAPQSNFIKMDLVELQSSDTSSVIQFFEELWGPKSKDFAAVLKLNVARSILGQGGKPVNVAQVGTLKHFLYSLDTPCVIKIFDNLLAEVDKLFKQHKRTGVAATDNREKTAAPKTRRTQLNVTWIPGDDAAQEPGKHAILAVFFRAKKSGFVGIDCEFDEVRGMPSPLALVQLHMRHDGVDQVYVLDIVAASAELRSIILQGLGDMLTDDKVVKVFHACDQDLLVLQKACSIEDIRGLLDVQLLHNATHEAASPDQFRIGLGQLLALHGFKHKTKNFVHQIMNHRNSLWVQRPLPKYLQEYVVDDVRFLNAVATKQLGITSLALHDDHDGVLRMAVDLCTAQLMNRRARRTSSAALAEFDRQQQQFQTSEELNVHSGRTYALDFDQRGRANLSKYEEASDAAALAATLQAAVAAGSDFSDSMMSVLPPRVRQPLKQAVSEMSEEAGSNFAWHELVEIALDEGRDVMLRFQGGKRLVVPGLKVSVSEAIGCLQQAKDNLENELGCHEAETQLFTLTEEEMTGWRPDADATLFTSDGRLGLPGTLHRISRGTFDRHGRVYNLTYRVGRHVPGVARIFMDLLADLCRPVSMAGQQANIIGFHSLLLVGPPGVGKTTLLRDISFMLAENFEKSVNVVDTSNEIAGDYVRPHACIGSARRFMVPDRKRQDRVLVEVVQNHTPEVIVVDEIGTSKEVRTMRDISQRGVITVGTAHGTNLESIINNHTLSDLVGGIQSVTIGDALSTRSSSGRKTRLERAQIPTFSIVIEVLAENRWRVHRNVRASVDLLLAMQNERGGRELSPDVEAPPLPGTELREYAADGSMLITLN